MSALLAKTRASVLSCIPQLVDAVADRGYQVSGNLCGLVGIAGCQESLGKVRDFLVQGPGAKTLGEALVGMHCSRQNVASERQRDYKDDPVALVCYVRSEPIPPAHSG